MYKNTGDIQMSSTAKSMESRVYDLMDWAEIEAVVYAEEARPRKILGPHVTDGGILVQAFFPGREKVSVRTGDKTIPMVQEDEAGFFAVMIDGKKIPSYTFLIEEENGTREVADPYAFPCQITDKEETRFVNGIGYHAYEKMGAHLMTINGVKGVYFAVWAPNALRVSVVGDFNGWDGRVNQMNRTESGIFELFVPGVEAGCFYKYEIKSKAGLVYLKADPYAFGTQSGADGASVVANTSFEWKDEDYIAKRESTDLSQKPVAIYELNVNTWKQKSDGTPVGYAAMAPELVSYVKDMGYTHVELMPVMEYPDDESMGYATSGFFAPTSRCGSPEDFASFIDTLHQAGIGVILDWVPSCFARGNSGLASFDGTCLYEHLDPKKGVHPVSGNLIFNYGRGEVQSFLLSSALFWINVYHADGLRINDLATMLYLDYGRKPGEWIANIYGGNENLEAIAFLKKLNLEVRKEAPGVITVAEEETGFPQVTGDAAGEGLGFSYKWNNGCVHDYMKYIQLDPLFRGAHQDDLTFSSVYMYSEKFMIALSHDLLIDGGKSLIRQMPGGKTELKEANLRLTYAYLLTHPGKKLITMGQDFGQGARITAENGVDWNEASSEDGKRKTAFFKALLKLYREQPALYELDENPEGFEWISNLDWERNMLVFLRKSMKTEETLLIVANFSNVTYENMLIGVPYPGKYKEIFSSDAVEFGGTGAVNPRVKLSRAVEHDERKDSIKVKIAPLSVAVYRFTEAVERIPVEAVKKARKATAKSVTRTAKKAGKTAEKAGNTVKKAAEDTGKTVREAADEAGKVVTDAVNNAGKAVTDVVSKAGKAVGGTVKKASSTRKKSGTAKKTK
jgi:1,4-alpha-glucan branching enzyme